MSLSSSRTVVSALTSRDAQLAELGAIVTANNTPGTAISGHAAATTFDHTKALLYVFNGTNMNLFPTALRLKLSNAGTAGTTVRFEQIVDIGPTRYSSGGTALTVQTTNPQAATPAGLDVHFGAVVLAAPTASEKVVTGAQYRNVIGVVTDTYNFLWGSGGADLFAMGQASSAGTSEADILVSYPAICVPSGNIFAIHQWSGSQSGAYQFEPINFECVLI